MGKKYIVELGRLERLYKAYINGNGKPNLAWLSPEVDLIPYTEPDMEQVRKEWYENGYENGFVDGHLKAKKSGQKFYEDGYQRGLNDAWEAARKIFRMSTDQHIDVFNISYTRTIIETVSASEAIEKIRQYEQEQEEQIQVGDEVIRHYKSEFAEGDDAPSIFLYEEYGHFRCLAFNGRSIMVVEYPKNQYRKTGRHFPEIAAVLEKMREES